MTKALSVSSVKSRCSVETSGRIGLVLGLEASFLLTLRYKEIHVFLRNKDSFLGNFVVDSGL